MNRKPPLLTINDLYKSYNHQGKKIVALRGVSLEILPGDVIGIIGLSGAGKSTLVRCLAALSRPDSGAVCFDGEDIFQMSQRRLLEYRSQIGMIFQHFNLYKSRSALENICFPLEVDSKFRGDKKKRALELLQLVGLEEKAKSYPVRLSGGEKQRVGIARALANHPRLLLCDEATSALDPHNTEQILKLLQDLHRKMNLTLILITHEMNVVKKICKKVAVMDRGEIVEYGSVVDIFSHPAHELTKRLLQNSVHDLPPELIQSEVSTGRLLRLKFKGKAASQPLISEMVKRFSIDANILLGWIDRVQETTIGTLVIQLLGPDTQIEEALKYLKEKDVYYEVLDARR